MAPQLDRSEKFQIRVTPDERKMLEAIAERDGLSASDKLRQLIRQDHGRASVMLAGVSLDAADLAKIYALPKAKVLEVLGANDASESVIQKLNQLRSGKRSVSEKTKRAKKA